MLITDQQPQRMPSFDEVGDRVTADADAEYARNRTDAAIDEIVAGYRIVVGDDLQEAVAETEVTPE